MLLTYDTGIRKNKDYEDYEGYDLGAVDGFFEGNNDRIWALPNSDFSDVVGLENTLASKGDTPAYYILRNSVSPSTLELMAYSTPTRQEPGNIIAVLFSEQFQQEQEHEFVIEGNTWMLPEDTTVQAEGGETMLFVFNNDYIIPVSAYESFYAKKAGVLYSSRAINGVHFNGSAHITNYGTCSTAAATAAKTASVTGYSLLTGSQVRVKFTYANTASAPTLNITSTGAKSMRYKGVVITGSNFTFDTTKIYTFTYTGTYYDLEGDWDEASNAEPMVCAYRIASYTANHIELDNYTYNGQTMNYREGAIILITNSLSEDVAFEGGTLTLDGNEYEANAFTIKVGATALFSLGVDSGILYPISSVVGSNSGSSSEGGSSAYPEVNHGTADTTFELTPNTFHVWDEVSELSLTLGAETAGVANEYLFQFTSGLTPTTLILPDDIKFSEDSVIEANKIYQVSILKGLVSVLSWDNSVALIDFTIQGVGYQADAEMTWGEWCNSAYNTGGFYIANGIVRKDENLIVVSSLSYSSAFVNDIIESIPYLNIPG